MTDLPPQAIQLPDKTPKVTEREMTELEIFRDNVIRAKSSASILAILNPQKYGEMLRYLTCLYSDIDAFYEAFKTVKPEQVAEEAIQ